MVRGRPPASRLPSAPLRGGLAAGPDPGDHCGPSAAAIKGQARRPARPRGTRTQEKPRYREHGNGHLPALLRQPLEPAVPYLAVKGPRVFDDLEQPAKLELVSVTPVGGGISELIYRPIR